MMTNTVLTYTVVLPQCTIVMTLWIFVFMEVRAGIGWGKAHDWTVKSKAGTEFQ